MRTRSVGAGCGRALSALLMAAACSSDDGAAGDTEDNPTGTGGTMTAASASASASAATPSGEDSTSAPGSTSSASQATPADSTSAAETSTDDDGSTSLDGAGSSSTGAPAGEHVLLAIGYGGMRVRSVDEGESWQDYAQTVNNGGDDQALLRGCAFGSGRFVAAGWQIFSSEDGVQWEEHDNPTGQWLGAVAYGNDMFLGVGGGGYCARSDDGMTWESCTDVTDDGGFEHVRSTLFLDGLFYTADADGDVRSSPDGDSWTMVSNVGSAWVAVEDGEVVARSESAPAEFADLRLRGSIERADAGSERFVDVFDVPNGNNTFQAYRFAFCEGWVL